MNKLLLTVFFGLNVKITDCFQKRLLKIGFNVVVKNQTLTFKRGEDLNFQRIAL